MARGLCILVSLVVATAALLPCYPCDARRILPSAGWLMSFPLAGPVNALASQILLDEMLLLDGAVSPHRLTLRFAASQRCMQAVLRCSLHLWLCVRLLAYLLSRLNAGVEEEARRLVTVREELSVEGSQAEVGIGNGY